MWPLATESVQMQTVPLLLNVLQEGPLDLESGAVGEGVTTAFIVSPVINSS